MKLKVNFILVVYKGNRHIAPTHTRYINSFFPFQSREAHAESQALHSAIGKLFLPRSLKHVICVCACVCLLTTHVHLQSNSTVHCTSVHKFLFDCGNSAARRGAAVAQRRKSKNCDYIAFARVLIPLSSGVRARMTHIHSTQRWTMTSLLLGLPEELIFRTIYAFKFKYLLQSNVPT